jgi:hypothetical protein
MKKQRNSFKISNSTQFLVKLAIMIVLTISILDVTGWVLNIPFFKGIDPEWIPMKIITAFCFILSSIKECKKVCVNG